MPEVPTVAEAAGLAGFDMSLGYGLVAPAGTPRAIVERLNGALNGALATDEVRRRLAMEGAEPLPTTPAQHAAIIDREETKGAALVKAIGLKPNGRLNRWSTALAWWGMRRRAQRLARA